MKVSNSIEKAILAQIKRRGPEWVFSASDFTSLGSRPAVDTSLSRMAAAGTIRRAVRGYYFVPHQHPIIGLTGPDIEGLVKAITRKTGTRVQHTGASAANLLGLCDQVPAKAVYLTDGRSKCIRVGKLDIRFKKTSRRMMATAGSLSGLVIQAFRNLGKQHVDERKIKSLSSRLSPADRKRLLADARQPFPIIIWALKNQGRWNLAGAVFSAIRKNFHFIQKSVHQFLFPL